MKMIIMMAVLAVGLMLGQPAKAEHVDGEYAADASYGPGDKTFDEVTAQQQAYYDAAEKAQAAHQAWSQSPTDANRKALRDAQKLCVQLATFSWVKAFYQLEMGRIQALTGDRDQAILDYKAALSSAARAVAVKDYGLRGSQGDNVAETSHARGAQAERLANDALAKLGAK